MCRCSTQQSCSQLPREKKKLCYLEPGCCVLSCACQSSCKSPLRRVCCHQSRFHRLSQAALSSCFHSADADVRGYFGRRLQPRLCFFCFNAFAVCAPQGVDASPGGLRLISEVIRGKLGITMTVLMGANIANEVADEKFCETTIGRHGWLMPQLGVSFCTTPVKLADRQMGDFDIDFLKLRLKSRICKELSKSNFH